ncbi:MAG: endonuclease III domain-containing protein [Promethearchaeota archaeon]
MKKLLALNELFQRLFSEYGPQGWWPLIRLRYAGHNPTERGRNTWYHPNDFSYPHTDEDIFEIMVGAILTQNTSWENADKALGQLFKNHLLSPEKILATSTEKLAISIRSSGYYNQKAKKLINLCRMLLDTPITTLKSYETPQLRLHLLKVNGIGHETADEILLYGFQRPVFVIDAYTVRMLLYMGYFSEKQSYHEFQTWFHAHLPADVRIYNEFHALIVQHCVRVCKKHPLCNQCFLISVCDQRGEYFLKRKKKTKRAKNEI